MQGANHEGAVGIDLALRAVADPTRRTILRLVRDDERAAGELADYFPTISRPAVSQHLRVLSDAGLVVTRKDGNRRMYRARPEGLAEAWAFLDDMWADRLGKLKAAAEREQAQVDEQARRRRRRK